LFEFAEVAADMTNTKSLSATPFTLAGIEEKVTEEDVLPSVVVAKAM
jgi:hypothetical protein